MNVERQLQTSIPVLVIHTSYSFRYYQREFSQNLRYSIAYLIQRESFRIMHIHLSYMYYKNDLDTNVQ